jgi:polar amino acid transport system substrate-binding protein
MANRDVVLAQLAPAGVVRFSINLGNPILASCNESPNELSGITVDLAQDIAERLQCDVKLHSYRSAGQAVAAMLADEIDIGFFAIDPARADHITFSEPYLGIEGSYLVRAESPIRENEQVDQPCVKVVVGPGSAYDLHLSRELQNATILHAGSPQGAMDYFLDSGADVLAGLRHQLAGCVGQDAKFRLLPGRFMTIQQAIAVRTDKGKEAATFLADFVRDAKSSGRVHDLAVSNKIDGAIEIT